MSFTNMQRDRIEQAMRTAIERYHGNIVGLSVIAAKLPEIYQEMRIADAQEVIDKYWAEIKSGLPPESKMPKILCRIWYWVDGMIQSRIPFESLMNKEEKIKKLKEATVWDYELSSMFQDELKAYLAIHPDEIFVKMVADQISRICFAREVSALRLKEGINNLLSKMLESGIPEYDAKNMLKSVPGSDVEKLNFNIEDTIREMVEYYRNQNR